MNDTDKKMRAIIKDLNKAYGEDNSIIMSEYTKDTHTQRVSSGSLNLDLALGGGMPLGRTIELFGPESSGKTTVALLHAVEMQKAYPEKYIVFLDVEHAADVQLFEDYGLDLSRVVIQTPKTAEAALDSAEMFIRGGIVSLVILDSVSALLPSEEAQKTMNDQQMGLVARIMGKALRKITPVANETNTEVIFINQIREKLGVMYGNPETTPGGRALKFFASIRINVRAGERIKDPNDKENIIGHQIKASIVKNKTAMPFKQATFDLIYCKGVDKKREIADIAYLVGAVSRAGAYYQIKDSNGEKITRRVGDGTMELSFQGKDAFVDYIKQDDGLYELLLRAVMTGQMPTDEELSGDTLPVSA